MTVRKSPYTESQDGVSKLLLEVPHSGLDGYGYVDFRATDNLPSLLASLVRFESAAVRATIGGGCDAAVPIMTGLAELLAQRDAEDRPLHSCVRNRLARAFVDTNRRMAEVSGWALDGLDRNAHGHGVIWAQTAVTGLTLEQLQNKQQLTQLTIERRQPTLREPLKPSEFDELMGLVYEPYHAAIASQHRRLRKVHANVIHLALHSMPAHAVGVVGGAYVHGPASKRGRFDLSANTLPDVILIHANFMAASKRYVHAVRSAFEEAGLIVEDGKGDFSGANRGVTQMYGKPKDGVHVIGIEHVAHDGLEPERHLGKPTVNAAKAAALQPAYAKAIQNLLAID